MGFVLATPIGHGDGKNRIATRVLDKHGRPRDGNGVGAGIYHEQSRATSAGWPLQVAVVHVCLVGVAPVIAYGYEIASVCAGVSVVAASGGRNGQRIIAAASRIGTI